MSAIVLKWRPAISSYKMEAYQEMFPEIGGSKAMCLDWSVWDYAQLNNNDPMVMVKVGEPPTGIVLTGLCVGPAYRDEDWSGQGRETWYAPFFITMGINPLTFPPVPIEKLQDAVPDFEWDRGHSGLMISDEQYQAVQRVILEHLNARPWEAYEGDKVRYQNFKDYNLTPKISLPE